MYIYGRMINSTNTLKHNSIENMGVLTRMLTIVQLFEQIDFFF